MLENPHKVKKIRRVLLYISCGVVILLIGVIVYNITHGLKRPKVPEVKTSFYNPQTAWFNAKRLDTPRAIKDRFNESSPKPPVTNSLSTARVSAEAQQLDTQVADDLKNAMRASLSSNEITPKSSNNQPAGTVGSPQAPEDSSTWLSKDDPAMNGEKRNFIKSQNNIADNVLSTSLSKPIAPLVLSMGTKISAQLDQEINSDLPGQIYGHLTRDLFDSRTHSHLLIPAGSNLVGSYDNAIAYGQSRLLVAWTRINLPNGQWLDLQGMGGADPVGGSGFGDQVDNHYWKIFGATFLTSVLSVAPQLAQPQQSSILAAPTIGQTVGQSVGTQIAQTGTMLLQKNINIQPTIHIRAGFEFTVEVNKDIIFPASYTGNSHKLN